MASDYTPGKGPKRDAIDPAYFRPMPPVLSAALPYSMPRASWVDTSPQAQYPVRVPLPGPALLPAAQPVAWPAFDPTRGPVRSATSMSGGSDYAMPRLAIDPRVWASAAKPAAKAAAQPKAPKGNNGQHTPMEMLGPLGWLIGKMNESGGELPPSAAAPAAKAAAATPQAAAAAPTLDDVRNSALMSVINDPRGFSLKQLMAVGQAAPAQRKTPDAKDMMGLEAGELARQIFAHEIAVADATEDPAERDAKGQSATDRYYQRMQALAGVNMQQQQLQQALDEQAAKAQ